MADGTPEPAPTQPVAVRQLASFHACPNTAAVQWFPRGNIASTIFCGLISESEESS